MEDQSLINKIQSLRDIKPSKNWKAQTELSILGHKPRMWDGISFPRINNINNILQPRFALAFGLIFIAVMATLAFGTLPGGQNNIAKYGYAGLTNDLGNSKSTAYYLDYAAKNLAMIKNGQVKNTSEAVNTIKLALEKAQAKMPARPSSSKESADIVAQINTIQSNLNDTKAVLGADATSIASEVENVKQSTKTIIEREIYRLQVENEMNDLQNATLTADQQKLFDEAKGLYNIGKYAEALEKILELSNNNK